MSQSLLVTGASGQLGRQVVEYLLEQKKGPVIATTRDPAKLSDLAARGVDVRAADFDRGDSLRAAFKGADRLLLISTNQIFVPGQRQAQQKAAVEAAEAVGVKHILYTSLPCPRPSEETVVENDHFWTELAVMKSNMSWTFLRHALYTELLLQSMPRAIQTGVYATATKNMGRHYVTRADCARADAEALASTDTVNRVHDITGPDAVTAEDLCRMVTKLSGRPVVHKDIDIEEVRAGLRAAKLPEPVVGAASGFDVATAQGYFATVTPAVKQLTGREPESVESFLARNKSKLTA